MRLNQLAPLAITHRGLSVRGLARALGVDRTRISRVANGQCKAREEEVSAIASRLGLPTELLTRPIPDGRGLADAFSEAIGIWMEGSKPKHRNDSS